MPRCYLSRLPNAEVGFAGGYQLVGGRGSFVLVLLFVLRSHELLRMIVVQQVASNLCRIDFLCVHVDIRTVPAGQIPRYIAGLALAQY